MEQPLKDYPVLKSLPLMVTIFAFLIFVGFGTVASSDGADSLPVQTMVPEIASASSPDAGKEGTFFFFWWIIWIGVGVTAVATLYFVFANMQRKTALEFETTIIEDIVSAIHTEYTISEKDLHDLVTGIIASRHCSDPRLLGLLRIEYEVEKTSSSRVKRTTAVAIKKQNDLVLNKATRTMSWEDLPRAIRKEFILKNENVLVYSLYSDSEKGG